MWEVGHAEGNRGKRFGVISPKDERAVRRRRRSACENHPSLLGSNLHHVVVRASERTQARARTGHGSFVGASPAWSSASGPPPRP